jgi:hypothetical protein
LYATAAEHQLVSGWLMYIYERRQLVSSLVEKEDCTEIEGRSQSYSSKSELIVSQTTTSSDVEGILSLSGRPNPKASALLDCNLSDNWGILSSSSRPKPLASDVLDLYFDNVRHIYCLVLHRNCYSSVLGVNV